MAGRADDIDDDDYLPPKHRRASASRLPLVLVLGLVIGIPIIVGVIYFLSARSRQLADRAATVARAQADFVARPTSEAMGTATQTSNWARSLGAWRREPAGEDDIRFPYRFEFLPGSTISIQQQSTNGEYVYQGPIEVFVDRRDELEMRSLPGRGMFVYQFRLRPDGTLMLTNGGAEVVFTREMNPPMAPAPHDTTPR